MEPRHRRHRSHPVPRGRPHRADPDEYPTDCTADAQPVDEEARAQLDDPLLWMGDDNRVVGNVVTDSREWELAQILGESNPDVAGITVPDAPA